MAAWEHGWPLLVFVFAVGAALGSFLNVVIYRLPRAESLVTPPSHCTSCGARLRVYDLLPVLSYLLLRGSCRHCGHAYSAWYAVVEAVCGALAVLCAHIFGFSLYALAILIVCLCLVAVFLVDFDHMIIPNELVIIIAVIGITLDAVHLVQAGGASAIRFTEVIGGTEYAIYLPRSVVGLLCGAALLFFVGWIFEKLMGKPAMGGGDVKLSGAVGALLGPGYYFLSYFLLAVVAGAVIGLALMALWRRGKSEYIPFGPMLAASAIAVLLYGDSIVPIILARFVSY